MLGRGRYREMRKTVGFLDSMEQVGATTIMGMAELSEGILYSCGSLYNIVVLFIQEAVFFFITFQAMMFYIT